MFAADKRKRKFFATLQYILCKKCNSLLVFLRKKILFNWLTCITKRFLEISRQSNVRMELSIETIINWKVNCNVFSFASFYILLRKRKEMYNNIVHRQKTLEFHGMLKYNIFYGYILCLLISAPILNITANFMDRDY